MKTNEEIIITKNGKPISRLVPFQNTIDNLFGLHKGNISSHDDLLNPVGEVWDAEL